MTTRYDRRLIAPAGELDFDTAPAAFDPHMVADAGSVVVDLSGVTFVDAYALGKLVELRDSLAERGGSLVVVGASARVARTFSLAKLDSLL